MPFGDKLFTLPLNNTLRHLNCESLLIHFLPLFLLLLLKIIYNYNNRFDDVLLEYLHNLSLETNTAETFSKFSLKSIEKIDPRPLKITLKEPEQISLPFLIIEDLLVFINTEVLWDESTNYQF